MATEGKFTKGRSAYDEIVSHVQDHPDYLAMGIFAGYGEFDDEPEARAALALATKED